MTNKALTTLKTDPSDVLIPADADKDQASRLRRFCDWMAETGRAWHGDPDLARYRDYLGHADSKTALGYIGTMDAEARRAPALIQFDVSGLYEQGRLE